MHVANRRGQQEMFVTWTHRRGVSANLLVSTGGAGGKKMFPTKLSWWNRLLPLGKGKTKNWEWPCLTWCQPLLWWQKDVFAQPHKPCNVQPGEGKGVWVQFPGPGTAQDNIPALPRTGQQSQQGAAAPAGSSSWRVKCLTHDFSRIEGLAVKSWADFQGSRL